MCTSANDIYATDVYHLYLSVQFIYVQHVDTYNMYIQIIAWTEVRIVGIQHYSKIKQRHW